MDIRLNVEHPEYDSTPAFVIIIEPDRLGILPRGDIAWLTTQAHIKRGPYWDRTPGTYCPVLLDLQGVICSVNMNPPQGVPLHAPQEMPMHLSDPVERLLTLNYPFPRSFVQQLEEERSASTAQQDLRLKVCFWGSVLLMNANAGVSNVLRVRTESNDPVVRIARSDWLDRFLAPMGYPARRYVELPVLSDNQLPETQQAAAHLRQAWDLFLREQYRQAVQQCRQANDALLDPNKPTRIQNNLVPVVGTEKAEMINASLKALNNIFQRASHGSNAVEIDREAAEYVVGTMTLILHYIGRKLQ